MTVPPRVRKPKPPVEPPRPETVVEATELALSAADHLTDMDAGAVATLRFLAVKIDTEERLRELALSAADEDGAVSGARARAVPLDNVSIPTYLKFCESLGLTPAGRLRLAPKAAKEDPGGGSTVARLRGQLKSVGGRPA